MKRQFIPTRHTTATKPVSAIVPAFLVAAFLVAASAAQSQAVEPDFVIRRTGWGMVEIRGGESTTVDIRIKNEGGSLIGFISLSVSEPVGWSVSLDTARIENLAPGAARQVAVVITPRKTLFSDDYELVVTGTAGTVSKTTKFDVTAVAARGTWAVIGAALAASVVVVLLLVFLRIGRTENAD